jgi:Outer membrane protein beta-barrel domain
VPENFNSNTMKKIVLIAAILFFTLSVKGQVLISILLGDKLNTGKIEFGLDGGVNYMTLSGVNPSSTKPGFNIGFYFDIKTKSEWLFHTGVIVKSPMGAQGITPYPLNNPDLDNAFTGGEVERNIGYFNVPVMMKRPFSNHFFAEGGFMLGLMNKTYDEFVQDINKSEDLTYKLYNRDNYHPLDAGLIAGVGYRLMGGNGMNLGVRYYYGLVDITIDDTGDNVYNRSLYLTVGIPIGAGKAKAKNNE